MDRDLKEALNELGNDWDTFRARHEAEAAEQRARILHLEEHAADMRKSGGAVGDEQKQLTVLARFMKEGGKSKAAPDDWLAASSQGYREKAMSIGSEGDGGHAVPEVVERGFVRRMAELSPIRRYARVVSVTTAPSSHKVPVSLGGTASGWAGEGTARNETGTPTLALPSFPDGAVFAVPKASTWALDDIPGLQAFLQDEVAEEFAKQEGVAFLTGNASNKPRGFLYDAPVATDDDASPQRGPFVLEYLPLSVGLSPSTSITADGVIDVQHGLKAGYWPGAVWLMNRRTLAAVRKLKDEDRYLWAPSLAEGQPSTLLGSPVAICDELPSPALNAVAMVYGDLAKLYTILERPTTILPDPYTVKGQMLYYFEKRVSGHTVDNHAAKCGKVAAA